MNENFYESNDVIFNFVEDSGDVICIGCSTNPEISTLFHSIFNIFSFSKIHIKIKKMK